MKAKLPGIVLSLGLLIALFSAAPPIAPQKVLAQGCASALKPGSYEGSFVWVLGFQGTSVPLQVTETYEGTLLFNIACDGTVTGTFMGVPNSYYHELPRLTLEAKLEDDPTGLHEVSTCYAYGEQVLVSGKIESADSGAPQLTLALTGGWRPPPSCDGSDALTPLLTQMLNGDLMLPSAVSAEESTHPHGPRTWTWKATDWDDEYAHGDLPFGDPIAESSLDQVAKNGTVGEQQQWVIERTEGAPTTTPEEDKVPVVTSIMPQFQQFFLENIAPVNNLYTADIDWGGGQPGTVHFQIDSGPSKDGTVVGNSASTTFAMHTLSAGTHTLSVQATSAKGKTSKVKTLLIEIVAVPPWADAYKLQAEPAEEGASSIIYQNTANRNLPTEPVQALLTIPDLVPFIGGAWGMKATQFQTGLSVSSLGSSSNTSITGSGGFSVAGKDIPIEVNDKTSVTRTRVENNELQFVTDVQPGDIAQAATINFKLPDQTLFNKKLSLIEVFPGLSTLLDSGKVGKFIKQFDLTLFQAEISAELSGKGSLGIQDDQVALTGGSATMGLNVVADASPSLFGLASAGIQGNIHGTATFDLSLPPTFTGCSLDGAIFFHYSVIGFGSGTYPSDPTATQLASCSAFGSGRGGSLLMAPAAESLDPPKLTPRSPTWKPESIVTLPVQSDTGNVISSTLAENANAELSSPVIASALGGRLAVAWVSEDANLPRPTAWRIALRLFDGRTWGAPILLGDSANPSYSPSVAFDKNGQVVVAWVQGDSTVLGSSSELSDEMLSSLDVAYAAVDASGNIKRSGTMPGHGTMDFAPQLASGEDGSLWLAWESSREGWFIAPDNSPNTLQAARWGGNGWQNPEQVSTQVSGVTSWHLAARDAETTMVVAARAGQGASSGEVVAYERTAGGWQGEQRLAGSLGPAVSPLDAYNASGKPVVAWSTGQEIDGLVGDLKAEPMRLLQTNRSLNGLAPEGQTTTLILAGVTDVGKAGLWAVPFDPSTGKAGQQTILLAGDEPVMSLDSTAATNGDLLAVMSVPVRKTESLPAGGSDTEVLQGPELTSIDLVRLRSGASADASQVAGGAGVSVDLGLLVLIGGVGLAALLVLAGVLTLARRTRAANRDGTGTATAPASHLRNQE